MFSLETRPDNKTCKPFTAPLPAQLSLTGCADESMLIPYSITSPLWSDGASKRRFFALPNDATITVGEDGDFTFPIGTVLIKEFSLGEVKVETRFLMRTDKAWKTYTYLWRGDQSDADLVADGINGRYVPIGAQQWYLPSRTECFACHTTAAGQTLGPEVAQLSALDLATFQHIGILPETLPDVPPLIAPSDDTQPVEPRARAYLHANCSFCHREGSTNGSLDLRASRTLFQTGTCNVMSTHPDEANLVRIAPGDPQHSLIVVRMGGLGQGRMPPLASIVPDDAAVTLISQFISDLTACPEN
jgi:hypothetical protein